MFQKQKPWRSDRYLDWVRKQPCRLCGGESDPHHIIGVGGMSGMGMKAPDWATMPLCRLCHGDIHGKPEMWPMQWEMICRTIGEAVDAGVLKVGK